MENNEKYRVCEGGYGRKTADDGQAEQPMEQQVPEKQTNGLYRFGRKAPTAAELRAQWLEQQRHEAEIRQRFTI